MGTAVVLHRTSGYSDRLVRGSEGEGVLEVSTFPLACGAINRIWKGGVRRTDGTESGAVGPLSKGRCATPFFFSDEGVSNANAVTVLDW